MGQAEHAQHGGCLCGDVRYALTAAPVAAVHCHCRDCQRATGSGFATVFGLPTDAVGLSGRAHLGYYTLAAENGQTVTRSFCRKCGSPLFTEAQNNPGFLWIKAGSLDDSTALNVSMSCWVNSATPWAPPSADLPQFEGNPE